MDDWMEQGWMVLAVQRETSGAETTEEHTELDGALRSLLWLPVLKMRVARKVGMPPPPPPPPPWRPGQSRRYKDDPDVAASLVLDAGRPVWVDEDTNRVGGTANFYATHKFWHRKHGKQVRRQVMRDWLVNCETSLLNRNGLGQLSLSKLDEDDMWSLVNQMEGGEWVAHFVELPPAGVAAR